ncbi:MAG: endonuclease/exonuclease/phosphatase family protein [Candidatus Promineifilaceae bacterium]|nr:endonuclease/exonuclease/phosphatase family protein [Candidatus Promineifilaceae bacterium]
MSISKRTEILHLLVFTVLWLFFFQLLSEFVEALYSFGLLGTSIPAEIAIVIIFFSPLLLLIWRRELPRRLLSIVAVLALTSRLSLVLLDGQAKLLMAGGGVALMLLFWPALFWHWGQRRWRGAGLRLSLSLALAVLLSVLLRSLYHGLDLSLVGDYQLIGWALALPTALFLPAVLARSVSPPVRQADASANGRDTASRPKRESAKDGRWPIAAAAVGLMCGLTLLYFTFVSPVVLARWAALPRLSLVALVVILLLLSSTWLLGWRTVPRPAPGRLALAAAAAATALALGARLHQPRFPATPDGYPFSPEPVSPLADVLLLLGLILLPLLLVAMVWMVELLVAARLRPTQLALGFALGGLFMLLFILAQVFTTVYDYVPVVGPLFRDQFWLVQLILGLLLALCLAAVSLAEVARTPWPRPAWPTRMVLLVAGLLGMAAVAASGLRAASPPQPSPQNQLTVVSYNILQGYDVDGVRNYDGQLALLASTGADIIGLQESDPARIAGGNADVVGYLADQLDLYAYYGPPTVAGTFGVALLSRFPLHNARTHYLYSVGEQVAVIEATIEVGGERLTILVTHLGNGGPLLQQRQFLELVAGRQRLIALGDFNFRPDSEQYALTLESLADTWALARDEPGPSKGDRIDHIFVSPDLDARAAGYIDSPASDHPAVRATIAW